MNSFRNNSRSAARSPEPLARFGWTGATAPAAWVRTVPVQATFRGLRRLVRGTARKAGKAMDLTAQGGDRELPAEAAAGVREALMHLVGNAAVHGIEPPGERAAAGKLPTGRLLVRAYHLAGDAVFEVSDDGRGLPREQILAAAAEAGVIAPDEPLTDPEAFALILHPEMAASGIGCGLGMQRVRGNVESLGGWVEVASKEGVGTTFTLRLPLPAAMVQRDAAGAGAARTAARQIGLAHGWRIVLAA